MTLLAYEFVDRIRFYDALISNPDNKLFIPTSEAYRAGAGVDVLLTIGEGGEPQLCQGKVLAQRAKSGGGRDAGIWVHFPQASLKNIEQNFNVLPLTAGSVTGRSSHRVSITLPVTIDKPIVQSTETLDFSAGGVCLNTLLPLPVGQTLHLALKVGDRVLRVFGRIAWRGEENNTTGIQFRFHNDAIRNEVGDAVAHLRNVIGIKKAWQNKVLVVDDDVATVKALQRVLEHKGYHVLTATTGTEALSKARAYAPDVVFLDVLMPGMNGVEVCRALCSDVYTSGIAVLLTSVLPTDELKMILEEAGAVGALAKPYRFETLTSLVSAIYAINNNESLKGMEPPGHERRVHRRHEMALSCQFSCESMSIQGVLSNVSAKGAFLPSFWGTVLESPGQLIIEAPTGQRFMIEAKVARKVHWGVFEEKSQTPQPGVGLEFVGGKGLADFGAWLGVDEAQPRRRPRVVVVDDDTAHLEILRVTLAHSGFDILTFDSPSAVLDALQTLRPDLVIVDYMMPGMDGASLCRALRADSQTQNLKLWLYSSVGDDHLERLAKECGADGGLHKGLRPLQLSAKIQAFLDQSLDKGDELT